jgi:hypothetical protein
MDQFLENLQPIPDVPASGNPSGETPQRIFERFWPYLEAVLDHIFNRNGSGLFDKMYHAIYRMTLNGAWELLFEEFKDYLTGKCRRWARILKKIGKMEGKLEFGRAFLELSRFYKCLIRNLNDGFMYSIRHPDPARNVMSENTFEAQLIFTFKQEILNEFGLDDFLLQSEASSDDYFSDMFIAFKNIVF